MEKSQSKRILQQPANGLYLQGAYTYSKAIDNSSGSVFGDELNGLVQWGDLFDTRRNRGVADFDRTHRFVMTFNYELPFARWAGISNRGFGKVLHGWLVSGVVTFQSGTPFTLLDSGAVTLQDMESVEGTNFATLAPGATLQSALTSGSIQSRIFTTPTTLGFVDLSKFISGGNCVDNQNAAVACKITDPTTGKLIHNPAAIASAVGNVGRNTFRGPRQQNWDLSVSKTTNISERFKLEFRADAFDAWNHPSFQSPQAAGGSFGVYGQVDVAGGDSSILATISRPRVIQFGAKLAFQPFLRRSSSGGSLRGGPRCSGGRPFRF